ncbi:MAG: hypothetical protein FWF90_15685 [Promicromonosporaceae bacterium]|nr:hypothetical protein [Promicromonosporaceae bacterium]
MSDNQRIHHDDPPTSPASVVTALLDDALRSINAATVHATRHRILSAVVILSLELAAGMLRVARYEFTHDPV